VTRSFAVFLGRRAVAAVCFVVVVASTALVLGRLAPGDAIDEMRLAGADAASIEAARERLGLDRPVHHHLVTWLAGLPRLDLGYSSRFKQPVSGLLGSRLSATAALAALALLVAMVLGLPLGLLTGARPDGLLAWAVAPISIAFLSCPPLVAALALLLLGTTTGWLAVGPGALAIPALALALPLAASLERLQSQATADTLTAPDLRAAAARGIPPGRLIWVHAARQSLRPVLGVFGIVLGSLFSGSLAVEVVTAWPGLGRLTYEALISRDLYLLAGCALVGGALIAAGNLIGDVLRAVVDPRVRGG
jgi:peptide/nickel transport system permease protein